MRRFYVFWGILAGLLLYTGWQMGRLLPGHSALSVWAGTLILFWMMLSWQFRYHATGSKVAQASWYRPWAFAGSVLLGYWATVVALSLPLQAGLLLNRDVLIGLLVLAAVTSAVGLRAALSGPLVREITLPVEGLPGSLRGLRIAQISDLHVGPTIRAGYVAGVVDKVLALKPDLVAVTGDMGDGAPGELSQALAPLARLKAPLGVFFVTGNHEYYWDAPAWLAKVKEFGWVPLVDENRVVARDGARVLVGGVADTHGRYFLKDHRSDPKAAAASAEKTDFKLLLAHRPDSCLEAEPAGFDLQLSGHTHGGQFFPFSVLIRLFHRYHRGLHKHGRMWLYVNPGTGYWGPPHRFAVPSEITLLILS